MHTWKSSMIHRCMCGICHGVQAGKELGPPRSLLWCMWPKLLTKAHSPDSDGVTKIVCSGIIQLCVTKEVFDDVPDDEQIEQKCNCVPLMSGV